MTKFKLNPIASALGVTLAATIAASPIAQADQNPFGVSAMSSGYMLAAADEGKGGGDMKNMEGKCGENMKNCKEGKCGDEMKGKEGKCGEDMKKCKEGKCGDNNDKAKGMAKDKEGKCGEEGKCGDKE
jgi:uncharacterized low-complexity protein